MNSDEASCSSATGIGKSRSRGENFNQREKVLLTELVAWVALTNAFNAVGYERRTEKELRTHWKNMKQVAKNNSAASKRERRKTGGGPSEADTDLVSSLVSAVIPAQISSVENEYDDDYVKLTVTEGDTAYTVSSIGQIVSDTSDDGSFVTQEEILVAVESEADASVPTTAKVARSTNEKQPATSSSRKRSVEDLKVEILAAMLEEIVERKRTREEERNMRLEEHDAKMKLYKLKTEREEKCKKF